jgi:dipeptidase E
MGVASPRIFAFGGWAEDPLWDHILAHCSSPQPRLLYLPTAAADDPQVTLQVYQHFRGRADVSHVHFFPWPPPDLRERTLEHDVVLVGGGNTANMLAIWRAHGFDAVLREAWNAGVILCGGSAGAICWFEASVTDSFGPQLEGMPDGLGLLRGSACPHYDGEERRRPRYTELVRGGFPSGLAVDDLAALHFEGTRLAEVLTTREGSRAYRVTPDGEEPLEARLLT